MNAVTSSIISVATLVAFTATGAAQIVDGQSQLTRTDVGEYWAVTGNLPSGYAPSLPGSGLAYLNDSPERVLDQGLTIGSWTADTFPDGVYGLAFNLYSGGSKVFDNNGFLDDAVLDLIDPAAPLGTGDSMSNNFDLTYAGYLQIGGTVVVDKVTGFFVQAGGFDYTASYVDLFRLNIYSNVGGLPAVNLFDGDVLATDSSEVPVTIFDTGFSYFLGPDEYFIYAIEFDLSNAPVTLTTGSYWASHDVTIVPEPSTVAGIAFLFLGGFLYLRRRK